MASNYFGNFLKVTTFGESHGKAIGAVLDGFPAGVFIDESYIQKQLQRRAPGTSSFVSPRKEKETFSILSGVFEQVSTGAPIAIVIYNEDAQKESYQKIQNLYRPGHANFTYLHKYGLFDYLGGGRASARETAARVAAGALAQLFLAHYKISVIAFIRQIHKESLSSYPFSFSDLAQKREKSAIFCIEESFEKRASSVLEKIQEEKDSVSGVVEFFVENLPIGLGDPIYEKMEANLAKALMSLPASKAFEIGEPVLGKTGSENNDSFSIKEGKTYFTTNHAGGILAGITTGEPLFGRVFFKPTASIQKTQQSVDFIKQEKVTFSYGKEGRHDPCVAIRAVPVVEAMVSLTIADAILMNRAAKV